MTRDPEESTIDTTLPPPPNWPPAFLKASVVAGYYFLWFWIYDRVNAYATDPVRTIHLTNPASRFPWIIQPWTAVIYILEGHFFRWPLSCITGAGGESRL